MDRLYFLTTFSLELHEKEEMDMGSPEYQKAFEQDCSNHGKATAFTKELEEKYPEYTEWADMNFPFRLPFTSALCYPGEDADFEPAPESIRPSREEIAEAERLWNERTSYDGVPVTKVKVWEVRTKRTVGFFESLDEAKEIVETNGGDWEEGNYYDMAVIEGIRPGMYSSPEEVFIYSCEDGWIESMQDREALFAAVHRYRGIPIEGSIGASMG